jgi:hypothetical protein
MVVTYGFTEVLYVNQVTKSIIRQATTDGQRFRPMGALEKIQRNLDAIFKLLLLSLIIKNGVVSKH